MQDIQSMNYITEPDEVDLTVAPAHLTDEDAAQIAEFIRQYKAKKQTTPINFNVTAANEQEFEFLLALFRRLNVRWSLSVG